MRNAMVLSLLVGLAGCGGFGHILSDNTELPGSLPNTPRPEVENMRRVAGQAPQVLPILPQERNVWPVVRPGQSVLAAMGADSVPTAGARSQLVEREVDLPAGGGDADRQRCGFRWRPGSGGARFRIVFGTIGDA